MQLSTESIIEAALEILKAYGLGDLSIRRLAKSLGVAPAALYWHFPNKQALLAGIADTIVAPLGDELDNSLTDLAVRFYELCTTYPDGADLISAALPTGLMKHDPLAFFAECAASCVKEADAEIGDRARRISHTIVFYVLGKAVYTQTARALGASTADATLTPRDGQTRGQAGSPPHPGATTPPGATALTPIDPQRIAESEAADSDILEVREVVRAVVGGFLIHKAKCQ